jgi:hypothetical protein
MEEVMDGGSGKVFCALESLKGDAEALLSLLWADWTEWVEFRGDTRPFCNVSVSPCCCRYMRLLCVLLLWQEGMY